MQKNLKNRDICINKKLFLNYDILKKYSCGIVLKGYEVKSIRKYKINLSRSYIMIKDNELFLENSVITFIPSTKKFSKNNKRKKKLLLNSNEIRRIINSKHKNTIMPVKMFFNHKNLIKIVIAVCKIKTKKSKKEYLIQKSIKKEIKNYI